MPIAQTRVLQLISEARAFQDFLAYERRYLTNLLLGGYSRTKDEVLADLKSYLDVNRPPEDKWLFVEEHHFRKHGRENEKRKDKIAALRQERKDGLRPEAEPRPPAEKSREPRKVYNTPVKVAKTIGWSGDHDPLAATPEKLSAGVFGDTSGLIVPFSAQQALEEEELMRGFKPEKSADQGEKT